MKSGVLYLVSTPIGNDGDISLRAIETLKNVDLIVCEEQKSVNYLFFKHNFKKEYILLNEHNEEKDASYAADFISKGENAALVSDCGTPVFADPGRHLVNECKRRGIRVIPVPGASSFLSALVVSGFDINSFLYAGFLPKTEEEREIRLQSLSRINDVLVIMETPYRIIKFLESVAKYFKGNNCCFAYKLTFPEEMIIYGNPNEILEKVKKDELKGEFVLIIDNKKISRQSDRRKSNDIYQKKWKNAVHKK
ncbi:MAG: 16S rRNA (cytidine(1402)-2'-O)-methyltransferase [Candidatus Delongbacteria bacterium]|nr:16S rRNA (cytidine(1402)-2'-O)-methyltransferase [Candidatus Delongbacteria bacterium]MBN2833938.1 16S rRNA (cytidine(1402)-2'-O)-methyltransferase [Candidatus Delongbacteria bacterium]